MNADEIVKGLTTEILCENCPHNILHESECFTKGCYFVNAATLIESLQAQLTASQRRADAAVRDLNHIANAIANSKQLLDGGEETVACLNLGRCDVCKEACDSSGCRFEWRGPKGEAK